MTQSTPAASTTTTTTTTTKAVILVGGPSTGTRFRPLGMDCPKPLFPVAGAPLIYHHMQALAALPSLSEVIILGSFDQAIFAPLIATCQVEFPRILVRYLREYAPLGTGGALYFFRDEILRGNPSSLLVLNGDIASSFPLQPILNFHLAKGGVATLLSTRVAPESVKKYGCIAAELDKVLHFVEKPETFLSNLVSCGIYVFQAATIFPIFMAAREARARKDEEQGENLTLSNGGPGAGAAPVAGTADASVKLHLESDVLSYLATDGKCFTYELPEGEFWMQIKTGSSLIPANAAILKFQKRLASAPPSPTRGSAALAPGRRHIIEPVFIHPTAQVSPEACIGPNVSIGPRVQVADGVRIKDAIVLDHVEVKSNSCILNSVIGWDSKIGRWCRVEGSPSESQSHNSGTVKGIKIPSATILGKDVQLADERILRNCVVLPHKELKFSFHNEILM